MTTRTTMAFRELDGVLVAVHSANAPSDEEWAEYLAFCMRLPSTCWRTLAVTEGGGPNAKQRRRMQEEYLRNHRMRVAVVTDAFVVRGIVTALSWFNKETRWFPSLGLRDALGYLEIRSTAAEGVLDGVARMKEEVSGRHPPSFERAQSSR